MFGNEIWAGRAHVTAAEGTGGKEPGKGSRPFKPLPWSMGTAWERGSLTLQPGGAGRGAEGGGGGSRLRAWAAQRKKSGQCGLDSGGIP